MLTLCICTRNRAGLLDGALRTLQQQHPVDQPASILVVDNGSTDSTAEVVSANAQGPLPVRYLTEARTGLSHARNRGAAEAETEYVAFLDDDCEIPEAWLGHTVRLLQELRPLALGGPCHPLYEEPPPKWYRDVYAAKPLSECRGWLQEGRYLFGGNIVFRRAVLIETPFREDLGMAGKSIAYGEEVDVQRRIDEAHGPRRRFYDPEMGVRHLTRREKLRLGWLLRSCYAKGRDVYAAAGGGRVGEGRWRLMADWLRTTTGLVADASIGCLLRPRPRYPRPQNYWYEHTGQYLKRLGRLSVQLSR
ncbi:MAG: glycosyltransferase family 2 protein [Acidobacteria bacterium]|nr:MAG: glycosyltransferase family 2 protein [Acidobacteriota bacterium]REK04369.1 MAG: glycosyltransferase family 2 protein [Acidobacteriota bacterium]